MFTINRIAISCTTKSKVERLAERFCATHLNTYSNCRGSKKTGVITGTYWGESKYSGMRTRILPAHQPSGPTAYARCSMWTTCAGVAGRCCVTTDSFSWLQEKLSGIVWTELETENKEFWKWNSLFLLARTLLVEMGPKGTTVESGTKLSIYVWTQKFKNFAKWEPSFVSLVEKKKKGQSLCQNYSYSLSGRNNLKSLINQL